MLRGEAPPEFGRESSPISAKLREFGRDEGRGPSERSGLQAVDLSVRAGQSPEHGAFLGVTHRQASPQQATGRHPPDGQGSPR